jgi:hypothetical protein
VVEALVVLDEVELGAAPRRRLGHGCRRLPGGRDQHVPVREVRRAPGANPDDTSPQRRHPGWSARKPVPPPSPERPPRRHHDTHLMAASNESIGMRQIARTPPAIRK